jgi:DNA-binding beta-propeller fold protein YncE
MGRRIESIAPAITAAVVVLAAAAPALAKGGMPSRSEGGYLNAKGVVGPASMVQPPRAIVGRSGTHLVYVTQPTGYGTTLARVDTTGEEPVRTRMIGGGYSIPTVAIDKSTSGLSADGSSLVLARPLMSLWQRTTRFELLDGKSLRPRTTISLHGAYSFDAISPDGDRIYLIEYPSPRDPSRYLVRAYDVSSRRLLGAPVIDPDEKGEPMTGKPITRTESGSGRWAYTLYRGSDEGPFVHALDTVKGEAVCVDLAGLVRGAELRGASLAMSPDGSELTVAARTGGPLAVIDTETLDASAPPAPGADGGRVPWVLIAIAAALGLGAGGGIIVSRHRRASRLAAPDV